MITKNLYLGTFDFKSGMELFRLLRDQAGKFIGLICHNPNGWEDIHEDMTLYRAEHRMEKTIELWISIGERDARRKTRVQLCCISRHTSSA